MFRVGYSGFDVCRALLRPARLIVKPGPSTLCLEEADGSVPAIFTLIQTVLPAGSYPQAEAEARRMLSLLPEFFGSDSGSLRNSGQRATAAVRVTRSERQ